MPIAVKSHSQFTIYKTYTHSYGSLQNSKHILDVIYTIRSPIRSVQLMYYKFSVKCPLSYIILNSQEDSDQVYENTRLGKYLSVIMFCSTCKSVMIKLSSSLYLI